MRVAIEYRSISALQLDANNARLHSDAQIDQIAGSIQRFGFVNPLLVRDNGVLIAGEGRYHAARKLALAEVPVIVLRDLNDVQCRALALADNRIQLNSSWDEELLAKELSAVVAAGEDAQSLGFDARELNDLLMPVNGIAVEAVDVAPVEDRFWISIRGPLRDQAQALTRLQQVMQEFPTIEVELGTTQFES